MNKKLFKFFQNMRIFLGGFPSFPIYHINHNHAKVIQKTWTNARIYRKNNSHLDVEQMTEYPNFPSDKLSPTHM